jgi:hypothetical protein
MKKNLLKITTIVGVLFIMLSTVSAQTKFENPILITSAGQSADVKLVKLLAKKQNLEAETKLMAKSDDLNGIKTLIVVPGFSSKGLGAAGISQQDEMNRVEEIVNKAKEKNIPIIMVHIGGKARRGGQSDDFCKIIADNAKSMIVLKQGNEDNFFTQIAENNNVPIEEVEKISAAAEPLGNLFSK